MSKQSRKPKGRSTKPQQLKVFVKIFNKQVEVLPTTVFSEVSGIKLATLVKLTKRPGFPSFSAFGMVWVEVKRASEWIERESKRLGWPIKGWRDSQLYEIHQGKGTEQDERKYILEVLRETRGNQTKAAEILGVHRNTLRKKIQEYGINDLR